VLTFFFSSPPSFARAIQWENAIKKTELSAKKYEMEVLDIEFRLAQRSFKNLKIKKEMEETNRTAQIQHEWNQFYHKLKIEELLAPLAAHVKATTYDFPEDKPPEPELTEEEAEAEAKKKEEEEKAKAEEEELKSKPKTKEEKEKTAGFSVDDAMRILGFTERPTPQTVNERVEHLVGLNDPEKGGSPYLQVKAREAGDKVISSLADGSFPSNYAVPKEEPKKENEEEPMETKEESTDPKESQNKENKP